MVFWGILFFLHYSPQVNITHTSDIVVKRPRKASVGIQSHGIFPLLRQKKIAVNLYMTPHWMHVLSIALISFQSQSWAQVLTWKNLINTPQIIFPVHILTELKSIVFLCPTILPCRSIHLSHFMTELKIPHHPYTTHDDFTDADPTVTQDTCRGQLMTLFLFSVRSRKSVDRAPDRC